MNPYTSSGSVATMTANVSGNDNLNDLGDGPRQPGDPERYPAGAVTRRLLGYVRPHRISFTASFVSAAISVVLQLYTPILIGEGIDLIVAAGQVDFGSLLPLVTKLAIVVVGAAAFQWLQGYCVNRLSYETVRDMRVEASDKLSRMPLSFIDGHAHGDLMSRVVNDVDQVGDGLLQGFTQLFTGVITIVGTLAFMLSINLTMTLVVVLVTPLSIFAAGAIAKLSNKSFTAQQRIQGQLGGHIEEYVGEQKLVDAFAYGPHALRRGCRDRLRGRDHGRACGAYGGRRADLPVLRQPVHQAVQRGHQRHYADPDGVCLGAPHVCAARCARAGARCGGCRGTCRPAG